MTRLRGGKGKKKAEPSIEFVSPYPLEDCVWQLQNFPGVDEWFPIKIRVELSQVDDETWTFTIHKTYFSVYFLTLRQRNPLFMYFVIQAKGSIRRMPSTTTLALGKVEVSTSTYLINTLLL